MDFLGSLLCVGQPRGNEAEHHNGQLALGGKLGQHCTQRAILCDSKHVIAAGHKRGAGRRYCMQAGAIRQPAFSQMRLERSIFCAATPGVDGDFDSRRPGYLRAVPLRNTTEVNLQ